MAKDMKPPEKGGKPKKITTKGKPGDTGPWGATPARDRKKKKSNVIKRSKNRKGKLSR